MAIERKPRRSVVAGLAATVGRVGLGGTGLGGAFALPAGFGLGSADAGASALLVGPGFEPERAAARMLAVSRCSGAILAAGFSTAFAAAGLAAAALAAGFTTGFSAAAASPADFCRASFMISATLGRPPSLPTAGFAAGFAAAGFATSVAGAASSVAGAASLACVAASPAAASAFSARAAARISATDIFFRSAMLRTFTIDRDHRAKHKDRPWEPSFV